MDSLLTASGFAAIALVNAASGSWGGIALIGIVGAAAALGTYGGMRAAAWVWGRA